LSGSIIVLVEVGEDFFVEETVNVLIINQSCHAVVILVVDDANLQRLDGRGLEVEKPFGFML